MIEPINTGKTQRGQTSKNIAHVERLAKVTIKAITIPNTLNINGYSHLHLALFLFKIRAVTKDNVGIAK